MCINTHTIYNRYIQQYMTVDCGKCPACLQAKATMRANRIRNNVRPGEIALFITLTYQNAYIPFVYLDDLLRGVSPISVYRQNRIRFCRSSANKYRLKVNRNYEIIDKVDVSYPVNYQRFKYHTLFSKNNREYWQVVEDSKKVAVIHYPDIQKFFKRLRVNLVRKYGYKKSFSFFACAELGPKHQRPHFHALIFIPRSDEQIFRDAIFKSWSYDSFHRKRKGMEVARDCASYVASYVNSGNSLSPFFKENFKQKHSYSHGFGMAPDSFSLLEILKKADSGDMRYTKQVKSKDGHINYVDVAIPKYVIDRYFYRFKGYSRITPDSMAQLLSSPAKYSKLAKHCVLVDDDIHKFLVRICHQFNYYSEVTGRSLTDFVHDYMRVWQARALTLLKHSYDDIKKVSDWRYFYDNGLLFNEGHVRNDSLSALGLVLEPDVNKFPSRVASSDNLTEMYRKYDKHRKVMNLAMCETGFNV